MMKATKVSKKAYTRHSVEYKTEALKLVERVGVPEAARQLGLTNPNSTNGVTRSNTNKVSATMNRNRQQKLPAYAVSSRWHTKR